MQLKINIKKLKKLFGVFIMPFSITIFLVFVTFYLINIQVNFFNPNFILHTGLAFGFLSFFLWFKKLDVQNTTKKLIIEISSILFLINIALIIIFETEFLFKINYPNLFNSFSLFLGIFTGAILIYENKAQKQPPPQSNENLNLSNKISKNLCFIFIFLLGLGLRIWKLSSTKLLADEGYIALAARGIHKFGLPYLPSEIVYPRGILFSYITSLFTYLFGDNEISLRMVSILSGVLLILVGYLLTKKITGNKNFALLTSLVIAIHPIFIEFSRFSRWYMLIGMLYILCFYTFLNYQDTKKVKYLMFLSILLSLMPFMGDHGYLVGPFFVLLLTIYYLPSIRFKLFTQQNKKTTIFFILLVTLLIITTALAIYLERFSYYNGVKAIILEGRNVFNLPYTKINQTYQNLKDFFLNTNASSIIPSTITLICLFINLFSRNINIKKYTLLCLGMLTVSGIVIDRSLSRTYFFIIPFLLLNTIFSFYIVYLSIQDFKHKRYLYYIIALIVIFPIFYFSIQNERHLGEYGKIKYPHFLPAPLLDYNPDLDGAGNFLKQNYQSGDIIISSLKGNLYYYVNDLNFWVKRIGIKETSSPLNLYISERQNYWDYMENTETESKLKKMSNLPLTDPIYLDSVTNAIVLYKENDVANIFKNYKRIWVISSIFDFNTNTVGQTYYQLLQKNKNNIVYRGKDDITNVYLFENKINE